MVLVTVSGHFIIYFLRLFLQFKGAFINYMIVGMSKNITILPMSMLSQGNRIISIQAELQNVQ